MAKSDRFASVFDIETGALAAGYYRKLIVFTGGQWVFFSYVHKPGRYLSKTVDSSREIIMGAIKVAMSSLFFLYKFCDMLIIECVYVAVYTLEKVNLIFDIYWVNVNVRRN